MKDVKWISILPESKALLKANNIFDKPNIKTFPFGKVFYFIELEF